MNGISPIRYLQPVRLKHKHTGQYLYSANIRYSHSGTSRQQVVATAPTVTEAASWIFKHPNGAPESPTPAHVFDTGDLVRIEHVSTKKNLHTHTQHPSPKTRQQELTAFGGNGVGDENDDWELKILAMLPDTGGAEIILKNHRSNGFLHSHKSDLANPPIAQSYEATGFIGSEDDPNNVWIVEPFDGSAVTPSILSFAFSNPARALSIEFRSDTSMAKWYEAASKWIEDEASKWGWLSDVTRHAPETERRACQSIQTVFETSHNRIRNVIRSVNQSYDSENFQAVLNDLNEALLGAYGNTGTILYSKEPSALWSLDYGAKFPLEAIFSVGVLINQNPAVGTAKAVRGVTAAISFLNGEHLDYGAAQKKAFSSLLEEWQASAGQAITRVERDAQAVADRINTLDGKSSAFDQRAEKLIEEKTASIAALENTLRKKIALDDSIEYWKSRSIATHGAATRFGIVAGLFIILALSAVIIECKILFSRTKEHTSTVQINAVDSASKQSIAPVVTPVTQNSTVSEPTKSAVPSDESETVANQYWRYLIIAVTLTFAIWISRVLVKITMSKLHASADAEERVTMLQTFLSLMADGSINKQEDIKLILQTVFRPGTTGLIDEESGPQTPIEMILKNVSGGRQKNE